MYCPCKKNGVQCPNRTATCQHGGHCEEWDKFKAERERIRKQRLEENALRSYGLQNWNHV